MPHACCQDLTAKPASWRRLSAMRTDRREFLVAALGIPLSGPALRRWRYGVATTADRVVKNGRLKQSVSRWCYNSIPMPEFCRAVADMGLTAIDLLEEPEWAVARDHGLVCSMGYAGGGSIRDGLNVTANHDAIVKNFER